MRVTLMVVALSARLAVAQQSTIEFAGPQTELEHVWLDPGGRGSLWVGNGQTLPRGGVRFGVTTTYTYGNLRAITSGSPTFLLTDRFGVQLYGAVGLTDFFQLDVNVPLHLYQVGAASLQLVPTAVANPWINVRASLLPPGAPISLGVVFGLSAPVGTAGGQGNNGPQWSPRIQVGKVWQDVQVAGELGFLYRFPVDYQPVAGSSQVVASQLWLAGAVTGVNPTGPRGEASARIFAPIGGGTVGFEAQFGVRWPVGPVELHFSGGPGLGGAPSTPSVRVYAGVALANVPLTRSPCVEGQPYELAACPQLDRDQDGIVNALDRAPTEPEDRDGFEDGDGAPDLDDDGDGVPDTADRCPREKGVADNGGCPDTDGDGDGVVDRLDRCPAAAEDQDGFEDGDGCPDPDNDGDGVTDARDRCPTEKGLAATRGCPPADGDGDGVADHEDNCPAEAGVKENAGCPAAKKQLVVLSAERIQILDKVYFNTGNAVIQPRSYPLLDNIAQVLSTHPDIDVRIEGHTDNTGPEDVNKALSQDRAAAVKAYLVTRGVAERRLTPVGYGQERPAQPNDTPQGRDANRRVEFTITTE